MRADTSGFWALQHASIEGAWRCCDQLIVVQRLSDVEDRFAWLDKETVVDSHGKQPGHPEYDKRTVRVPPEAYKKLSASQKQYWDIKCAFSRYMYMYAHFQHVCRALWGVSLVGCVTLLLS